MAFLDLKNVGKGYLVNGRRTEVLRDVNLTIDEGEFVAIVGFSGAGKTTLISLIAGLLRPDAGSLNLNGAEITGPGPDRGVVFQNYSLLPWLNVCQNIHLAVDQIFPDWPGSKKQAHVQYYIELVGLGAAQHKRPGELSGGMRQRVSVARALATDPRILLLDEPLSALDALTRSTLQQEISRIWQADRKTVLMITNDPDEGIFLADRIIPLSAGPAATLGPSIPVEFARPRDRIAMNHDARFKEIRRQLISFLLASRGDRQTASATRLVRPEIEPEDLNRPRVSKPLRAARVQFRAGGEKCLETVK